jgi:hypothetical protein
MLKCYNLHYNIPLVEIMGYWGARAIKISGHQVTSCMNVIAVGSLFAHHKLCVCVWGWGGGGGGGGC